MSIKLKPCPFCGGKAHMSSDYVSEYDKTVWCVWHACHEQEGTSGINHTFPWFETPWYDTEAMAAKAWNTRADYYEVEMLDDSDAVAFAKRIELAVKNREPLTLFGVDYEAHDDTRWYELFGTPERAAQTLFASTPDCRSCAIRWKFRCDRDECPMCKPSADALLEWLRSDA